MLRNLMLFIVVRWSRVLFWSFNISVAFALLLAHSTIRNQNQWHNHRKLAITAVSFPTEKPAISQKSINMALKRFGILVPPGVEHPHLDESLVDRGVTTMFGSDKNLEVAIGPSAFTSWAVLGSTLAHEIEIHCKQSFAWIRMLDIIGLDGTNFAERTAYLHEINQSKRFGLTASETLSIQDTMDTYYPFDLESTPWIKRISSSMHTLIAK